MSEVRWKPIRGDKDVDSDRQQQAEYGGLRCVVLLLNPGQDKKPEEWRALLMGATGTIASEKAASCGQAKAAAILLLRAQIRKLAEGGA